MQLGPIQTGYVTVNQRRINTRAQFHIERLAGGSVAGQSKVDLFNLSTATRNWIETNPARNKVITVFAGYNGDDRNIFQGNYSLVTTDRDGTELKTSIQCADGVSLWQGAHVEFSGAADDDQVYGQVVEQLAAFGIVKGHYSATVQAAFAGRTYGARPCSDSGLVGHIMDNLVRRHGFKYAVENGTLNIYDPKHYEDQDEFFLSKDTGLVGFPSKTGTDAAGGIYKITSLFNPELTAGRKILVKSAAFEDVTELKINSLIHTGDTWRGGGKTEMECVPLGARGFLVVQ